MGYCVFFFQAEDGIRDLVRSRGLGDVYKRQEVQRRNIDPIESLEAVMLPKKVHELYGHIRDFNTMLRADRQCFSEEELTSLIAELDDEWRSIGLSLIHI